MAEHPYNECFEIKTNRLFNLVQRKLVKQLFKAGLVDFVASDMHSERINFMDKAYDKVRKRYGLNTAEKIFNENAKEIIKGQS